MVHLNHFHRVETLLIFFVGIILESEFALAHSLSLFNPNAIVQNRNNLTINTQTLLTNDAFSLEALFNDFEGDFYPQSSDYMALGDIRYDIGTYIDTIGYIGYTYRQEAVIKVSSDGILLIHQTKNDLDLSLGKRYSLELEIEGFEVHGITLANTLPLYQKNGWDIHIGGGVELLYGIQTQKGYIEGDATAIAKNDYDFSIYSHYLYIENYLYKLDVDEVTSYGYSTHIAIEATYNNYTLSILSNDILGKLYWENLPYSDVTLASENKSYNDNGYVQYTPIISGVEKTTKFTQTLMQKWCVEMGYKEDSELFQLGVEHIYNTVLPYVKYSHDFENNMSVGVSYESYFGMVGIDIAYKGYYFGLQSNRLIEPSSSKITLGVHHAF